jgi:hypothetical protein
VPALSGWADLDERESAADIEPGHPILVDPEFRIDPVLARFLARSRFTWLAEGTREAYAKDYRLFFSFLWQRGKYWHEADPDDLLDWESWRRRGQPGQRISGSKGQRELAALRLLYNELRRKLDDMRAERDEYKQAADALARALNLLTMENDKLRSQISRISSPATPAQLTAAN